MLKTNEFKEWLEVCEKNEKVFVGDEKSATTYYTQTYGISEVKVSEDCVKVFYNVDAKVTMKAGAILKSLEGVEDDRIIKVFEVDAEEGKEVNKMFGCQNLYTDITILTF